MYVQRNRRKDLERWLDDQLLIRLSKIQYYDPWDAYDIEYILRDYSYYCEYLDKHQQDGLVFDISKQFTDWRDLDIMRTLFIMRCKNMITHMERNCFTRNMRRFIMWSLECERIRRQLAMHWNIVYSVPPEIIHMIFSYLDPVLSPPPLETMHQYEQSVITKYIQSPDLRLWKYYSDEE